MTVTSLTHCTCRISTTKVIIYKALFSCYMAGATRNCCRLSARSVYNIQPCASIHRHFIRRVQCVKLPATCTGYDQDVLRAIAATRGWNGYRNKSQHRKLTLGKKILPPLLSGLEPATFESRVRCSTTELSLLPTLQSTTVLDNVLSTASCHILTINQNHTCLNRNRPYLPALAWQRT